jgi:hypothetical protein
MVKVTQRVERVRVSITYPYPLTKPISTVDMRKS